MAVQPIQGKSNRFFTAVPSETESQRADRTKRERAEARDKTLAALQADVDSNLAEIEQLTRERDAENEPRA